ncbi:4Fe-4S binding protein [Actibacterium sp. 188UL27-1]|uniref:4Fe-4S binding protein n=1 Tax=Actibacterium sp. 188UL27-1 TaxID=2786961 RepID=UPI00195DA38E|nr:4Fe-4S binding protein [Actibacterium sp. 188UL27-1]MBM7066168.1 4Fe-4S binding protein [Actibacterium sp. 188UL27-1]
MWRLLAISLCWLALCLGLARAETLTRDQIAPLIVPPYALGEPLNDQGVWSLRNSGGAEAGYVFETQPMAPLPGFSGAPINMLVILDLEGRFLDVRLIEHNEPIFVSGLGEAPFHKFFEQYRGHSISDSLVVGTPYGGGGDGGQLIYLDGVTKATASVRIAHESLLAAALQVAREKMQGISTGPPAHPNVDYDEALTWAELVDQGLATNIHLTNAEIDERFAGTLWENDDPEARADPDGTYLDLWLIDLGPPAIARAVLSEDGFSDLQDFMSISTSDEPILVIDTGRHGLVSEDFVRNTAPDWITAEQSGFPIALRDADLLVELNDSIPIALQDGAAMILRTDRRLGFDPTAEWVLKVQATREHGMFQPETGSVILDAPHATDERFYLRPSVVEQVPPWLDALRNRQADMIVVGLFLTALILLLGVRMNALAGTRYFTPIRLGILAAVTGFIGWWGQGQLSIVTVLGVIRTTVEWGSFAFLLYDPFSLIIWAVAILGFVLWGRGLFCGWLCPFGALQEFAHHIGRVLRLPQIEPSALWDARLKYLKYVALAGLLGVVFFAPSHVDKAAEIEPFKTAITTFFIREWYYVAYAVLWLVLGAVLFKGFCRYLCPLGAVMAIGGLIRGRDWIARRTECGSPCQLCKVKCNYGAIKASGEVQYSECFGCLDCVTIHDDKKQCVPLILAARKKNRPLHKVAAE